jgi:hypothetical protein
MDIQEMKARYLVWFKTGTRLPYLEEWEQWGCTSIDDPELYEAIKEERIRQGVKNTNTLGIDLL